MLFWTISQHAINKAVGWSFPRTPPGHFQPLFRDKGALHRHSPLRHCHPTIIGQLPSPGFARKSPDSHSPHVNSGMWGGGLLTIQLNLKASQAAAAASYLAAKHGKEISFFFIL